MSTTNKYRDFLESFDLRDFAINRFEFVRTRENVMIPCIYHADNTPSMSVSKELFFCHGCGAKGDSINFLSHLTGLRPHQIIDNPDYKPVEPAEVKLRPKKEVKYACPHSSLVQAAQRKLWTLPDKLFYLRSLGLKLSTIYKHRLGYYSYPSRKYPSLRYTIPIYDEKDRLVTIRYRRDDTQEKDSPKYLVYPRSRMTLFNLGDLAKSDTVVLAGSQIDALLLSQEGVPSVGPPSENIFKQDWASYFDGKTVVIFYDNDDAGQIGASRVHAIVKSSVVVDWPKGLPESYDIGDAYREHGILWLKDLLNHTLESKAIQSQKNE